MTAEPDLLPLPEVRLDGFTTYDMTDFARANVAHFTAVKDAEIEALRAEVAVVKESLTTELRLARGERDRAMQACETIAGNLAKAEARAERLAEALREMREYVTAALQDQREAFAGHEDSSDIPGIEADLHKIDALLREQENDDA